VAFRYTNRDDQDVVAIYQRVAVAKAKCQLLLDLHGAYVPDGLQRTYLPSETSLFKPSTLPGYALVQNNCMICHSVHYIQSQPPASPRAYWEATVKKMKKPFGAQFSDADIPDMVDYLVKTYGAERTAAVHPAAATK